MRESKKKAAKKETKGKDNEVVGVAIIFGLFIGAGFGYILWKTLWGAVARNTFRTISWNYSRSYFRY